jgi:hypothetical protein
MIIPSSITSTFSTTLLRAALRAWEVTARTGLLQTVTEILTDVSQQTASLIIHLVLTNSDKKTQYNIINLNITNQLHIYIKHNL